MENLLEEKMDAKYYMDKLKDGYSLDKIPKDMLTYKLCMHAVRCDGYNICYVPKKIIDFKMCEAAIIYDPDNGYNGYEDAPECISNISSDLFTRKMLKYTLEYTHWSHIQYAPERVFTKKLSMKAVECNPYALRYIPDRCKTKEICQLAFDNLEHCDFYIEGLDHNTDILIKYVPSKLLTEEMCLIAVRFNWRSIKWVPEKLLTLEICQAAVDRDHWALKYVPDKFYGKINY